MPDKNKPFNYKYYLRKARGFYQLPTVRASSALILSLLVASFFAFFAIRPTLVTIIKLNRELKEKKEVNQKLEKKINDLKKAQANYAQVVNLLPLVEEALPEKAEFKKAGERINFLAYSHNLILESASFGEFVLLGETQAKKEAAFAGVNGYTFNLNVNGSFKKIKTFLQDLENMDRLVKIEDISLVKTDGAKKEALEAKINGLIFWLGRTPANEEIKEE